MTSKGLIIPSSIPVTDSGTASHIGGEIDPALIRSWVMFWDEFICPENNFIGTGLPSDLEFLLNEGLLNRNRITFSGTLSSGNFGNLFLAAQEITYRKMSVEQPGKWTMAQAEGIIRGQQQAPNIEACLVFDLINSIQLPSREVPIADILEFKQRRKDELIAFHSHLEEIYVRISNSKDILRSKTHELQKLEQAIADYNKTIREKFSKRFLSSFRVILDRSLISSVGAGMGAASLAPSIDLPALGAGVMVGSASFAIQGILTSRNHSSGNHPLTYVTSIETELH